MAPVELPWTTGFEDQTCAYSLPVGFCYAMGSATDRVVTAPVHAGDYAAAFTVTTGMTPGMPSQVRCVRQGMFPAEAYYGAWYFFPQTAVNSDVWNLFHFQGGDVNSPHGLWDVSLINGPSGKLNIRVFDFLHTNSADAPALPIGAWTHIVFYFKRAKDQTGQVALYQDGVQVVQFSNLNTDDTDWEQWYVGNYATALSPSPFTVYVDDVTISATL